MRKRYNYKGCLWGDRQPETKAMLNRLLVEIDSPLVSNNISEMIDNGREKTDSTAS